MNKHDFAAFQERLDNRFTQIENRFAEVDHRFEQVQSQIKESELRLITRLGFMMVSTMSIAVAVLTWLIKL